MQQIPLLIIGAGPAGLSTALHLLRQDPGWAERMVVLDRARHPRKKLCGGGVTRLGLDHLAALGLPTPLPIPHAVVRDARFRYRERTVHVRGRPEFVVFHREEFDHYLARTAQARGVDLREGEGVLTLAREPGRIVVTTEKGRFAAEAVVGADGSRGITRRFMRPEGSPARVARLLEGVQPAVPEALQFSEEYALFDFTPAAGRLQGYVWDFPSRVEGQPHHNRGIFDARMAVRRPKAPLPSLLREALSGMGSDPEAVPLEGHPIHWFSPRGPFAGERILLVGDAAGAEPLFGEGIAPALGYGRIAAASLNQAFDRGDFSFSDYRRRILISRLGFYLLLRWWVAWWSYRLSDRPWFMHTMWTIGRGLAAFKRG